MKDEDKRRTNEKKFDSWEELPHGCRRFFFKVQGRFGWTARYVKEVDASEKTTKFYQEIYDEENRLVEIHEKYPENKGHRKIEIRQG